MSRVKLSVIELSQLIGHADFLNLVGDRLANTVELKSFCFGSDAAGVVAQGRYRTTIGLGSPRVPGFGVVFGEFLQQRDGSIIWAGVLPCVLTHALKLLLPSVCVQVGDCLIANSLYRS